MKNGRLRLLSLLIALCLWYFASTNVSTVTVSAPLELVGLSSGKVVTSTIPAHVQIRVRGPSFMVSEIVTSPPTLRKVLPDAVKAKSTLPLLPSELSLPSVMQVLSITPSELEFSVERQLRKKIPVQIPRLGTVPRDKELVDFKISPETVMVEGPESQVSILSEILAYPPLDFRDIEGEFRRSMSLRRPGTLSQLDTEIIEVSGRVELKKSQEQEVTTSEPSQKKSSEGVERKGRSR